MDSFSSAGRCILEDSDYAGHRVSGQFFTSQRGFWDIGREIEWDGRYLFNWSRSGEDITIIDVERP